MYLRDIVISTDRIWMPSTDDATIRQAHEFARNCHCVTDLFIRALRRKLATENTAKVIIELALGGGLDPGAIKSMINVMLCPWPFDFRDYFCRDKVGKKTFIADILHDALLWIANVNQWEENVLEQTFREVVARGLRNEGFWKNGKVILNPERRVGAQLYYEFDIDLVRITAVFVDRTKKELYRKALVDERPFDNAIGYLLGELKWRSNRAIVLCSRRNVESWTCELERSL